MKKHPVMTPVEFGRLRQQIGTQEEVADEMQTARRTLGRWESGERPVPGVAAVCIRELAKGAAARRADTLRAIQEMEAKPNA